MAEADDVRPAIIDAYHLIDRARQAGQKVVDFVNQIDIEHGATRPELADAAKLFFRNEGYRQPAGRDTAAANIARRLLFSLDRQNAVGDLFTTPSAPASGAAPRTAPAPASSPAPKGPGKLPAARPARARGPASITYRGQKIILPDSDHARLYEHGRRVVEDGEPRASEGRAILQAFKGFIVEDPAIDAGFSSLADVENVAADYFVSTNEEARKPANRGKAYRADHFLASEEAVVEWQRRQLAATPAADFDAEPDISPGAMQEGEQAKFADLSSREWQGVALRVIAKAPTKNRAALSRALGKASKDGGRAWLAEASSSLGGRVVQETFAAAGFDGIRTQGPSGPEVFSFDDGEPSATGFGEPKRPQYRAGGSQPPKPPRPGKGHNGGPPLGPDEKAVLSRIGDSKRRPSWDLDALYTEVKDDIWPIRRAVMNMTGNNERLPAEQDPYVMARLTRGSSGMAQHFIEHSPFRFSDLKDTGKSLKAILKPFQNDIDGFNAFAVAKRALELHSRDIETGVPHGAALNTVARGEQRYGRAFRELQSYNLHLVQYIKDAGLISGEMMHSMLEANRDYVPFFRILDDDGSPSRPPRHGLKTGNPVRSIRGSKRKIVNPVESIVRNTYLFINLAERNRALQSLEDLAAASPSGEDIMEQTTPGGRSIDLSDAELKKFMKEHGIEGDPKPFSVFRPNAFRPSLNQIVVYRDGKPRLYNVPRELADAINALDRPSHMILTKILSYPAQTLRAGAVLAPEFVVKNMIRDQGSAFINSRSGYVPYVDFLIGLGSTIGKTQSYRDWLKGGGANSALVSLDRNYIDQNLIRLKGRTPASVAKNVVTSPLEMLRILSELAENATRVGEFRRSRKKGRNLKASAFEAREITLDFQRIGARMHAVNKLVAFFNATIEGPDRTVRAIRERPLSVFLKAAAFITIPSLLLTAANWDDPRVQEANDWERDNFWIIPTDDWREMSDAEAAKYRGYKRQISDGTWQQNVGEVYRIPKPFDLGLLFGSLPERALTAFFKQDARAFDDFAGNLFDAFVPGLIPTVATPVLEQWTNYDFWFGRQLVPQSLDGVRPQDQAGLFTSDTAKEVAGILAKIGLGDRRISSPIVLQNYITDWTGTLGRYALHAADAGLKAAGLVEARVEPTPTWADVPVFRSFISRYPSSGAHSIGAFYDRYRREQAKAASRRLLVRRRDANAAREVPAPVILDRTAAALAEQRRLVESVYLNPKMSPDEKRELIDRVYFQMIDMARRANEAMDDIESRRATQ